MAETIPNSKQTSADIARQQVARVYALALVDAASTAGNAATILREFAGLVDEVLDQFPELENLLVSALISFDEKAVVLDRILANRIAPLLLSFLKVVGRRHRFNCLRAIRHEAIREYNRRNGKVAVELRVALAADPTLAADICQTLCDSAGVEPILETVVDPALVAGFTLTIEDTVYDGSVRTRFRNMRDAIVQQTIHMIQTQHMPR